MKIKFSISLLLLVFAFTNNIVKAQSKKLIEFKPTDESLSKYKYPEWFKDAKFGIWAHWGPQAVPRQGDWYARNMYRQGSPQYNYHLEHYGHPSVFGYKDIIPLWKAQKFNPEELMALYKKAGAKYFVSMGTHHDNFFLWNSKLNPWNSVKMGPHKDIVSLWQKAAKKEGLKFGVSEHLVVSYSWFQYAKDADSIGKYKGIPYDGANPKYESLYHKKGPKDIKGWMTTDPEFQKEWLASVEELVDNYHPDLLYSDSKFPLGYVGKEMLAHFYNTNQKTNNGNLTAVYTCKEESNGQWTYDVERGVMDSISPFPWQTDTSIGDWFYRTGQKYKSAKDIEQLLCDIVSKNGNLLINIVQTPEGDLDPEMITTLTEIGDWMNANGEGIYGSRPWKIYGEKSTKTANLKGIRTRFNEKNIKYDSEDIRFTTKGNILYAYSLAVPADDEIKIKSLGKDSALSAKQISNITLLGFSDSLKWKVEDNALVIKKPLNLPKWDVLGFKIEFKN